jgi:hypothetical protein
MKQKLSLKNAVLALFAAVALPVVTFAAAPTISPVDSLGGNTLSGILTKVLNIILGLTGLVAVIFLIIGGVKYITSGGNDKSVAAAKNTIMYAVIGIIVIFLAYVIVKVIANTITANA